MKRKLFLLLCAMLTSVGMWADEFLEDVTSTYLTNAAVSSTTGWTGGATSTDVNWTGAPENVCLNHGWYTDATNMYQVIENMPAGVYKLTVMTRGHAEVSSNIYVAVGGSNLCSAEITKRGNTGENNGWGETTLYFALGSESTVNIGWYCYSTKNQERWANADYFKLYSVLPGSDITNFIVNHSFETGDKTGWTDESGTPNMDIQTNKKLEGMDGDYYIEKYWETIALDLHQTTTTLPSGYYRITARALAVDGNSISLYAKAGSNNEVTQSVTSVDDYSVEVYQSTSGTIKFGLKGSHTAQKWVAVDNFRLTYLGDLKADLSDLQGTIDGSYLNNAIYTNVGGSERTALTAAKTATAASETAAAYEDVIAEVQDAIDAFVAAKDNYDALAAINAKITAVGTLSYASSVKKPSTHAGTSSSDAASSAASLTTALRAYVESNALAEGVIGATDYTSSILEHSCEATAAGDDKSTYDNDTWTCYYVRANGGEGYTNSEGEKKGFYFDSNGWFWGASQWGASLEQTISDLPTGKYLLTVTSRSSGNLSFLKLKANGKEQAVTNPNGVFGNGWDDTSVEFTVGNAGTAAIEFAGNNGGGSSKYFSVDNFRLVRLGDLDGVTISETATSAPTASTEYKKVTLTRTLSSSYWNTFSVPFDLSAEQIAASDLSGAAIKEFSSAEDNVINFTDASSIEAGKPYLVKPTSTVENPVFDGVMVESTEGEVSGDGAYKFAGQIYNKSLSTDGTIAYLDTEGNIKKLTSGGIKGLRAYFIIPSGASEARIAFIDDPTAINTIEVAEKAEGLKDGKYLIGGKIVVVKNGVKYSVNGQKLN